MTAKLIDGTAIAKEVREAVAAEVAGLVAAGYPAPGPPQMPPHEIPSQDRNPCLLLCAGQDQKSDPHASRLS